MQGAAAARMVVVRSLSLLEGTEEGMAAVSVLEADRATEVAGHKRTVQERQKEEGTIRLDPRNLSAEETGMVVAEAAARTVVVRISSQPGHPLCLNYRHRSRHFAYSFLPVADGRAQHR